ncbi:MAG: DUF2007 domain-containing protein [Sphingomicrobium sp.]
MSLVELRRFRSRMDGEIARTFLESHGFHTILFDAETQGYIDGLSADVRLMVLDDDREEAEAALDDPIPAAGEPPAQG